MRKVGDDHDSDGDERANGGTEPTDGDGDADASAPATESEESEGSGGYVVPTDAELDRETDWRAELADAGRLTASAVDTLVTLHGARGSRAIDAVSEKRVKRYCDFTVVVGHEDEYVVEDGGCTCKDSSYNLDAEDPNQRCWHVLAAAVAERIGEVDHHDMWYSDVREFL
ncbi:hypothetical protein SAMN04488063_0360 [Halopelagius inordinatus]|uniref:SWIM-type domain-containing protein n=1 Tax=Halopelagius inordinatus TaxID=553467 RepID=A0A1I2LUF4_9EURY|nr:hypothetical protein [Halopelagius inordinatus]SFF80671.1 hypothetical protein SAMN04488063_0360 [Halopelagius inordinatus]